MDICRKFITLAMENAFERAYDAYVQRKQVERQLRLLQLRADLAAPAVVPRVPLTLNPAKRPVKGLRGSLSAQRRPF